MDTTLILYCAFSYLFVLGKLTEIEGNTGDGFGIKGLVAFLLAPFVMPFYLGSK